jgi:hypothetical protein
MGKSNILFAGKYLLLSNYWVKGDGIIEKRYGDYQEVAFSA